eukprot:1161578-Pelagomonas_calceolata.AAC.4
MEATRPGADSFKLQAFCVCVGGAMQEAGIDIQEKRRAVGKKSRLRKASVEAGKVPAGSLARLAPTMQVAAGS